jgi:hypothetical protein
MNARSFSQKPKETFIGLLTAGVFLCLFGVFFIITPNLLDSVVNFFNNFDVIQVPNMQIGFLLPAPKNPAMHVTVYSAASQFSFAWGIFLIGLLVVRIFANSPLNKKAQTASDIVFWLAASYLINYFLNSATTRTMWFTFWTALIMLIGFTLIIRAAVLAVFR